MTWIVFIASSAVLVLAAIKLAQYGDVIAVRTRLGGMFIGVLLLAGATSLPELLTTINSFGQGVPGLAAGNMLGSNMFNMLLLAVLDLVSQQARILRRVAMTHALTAALASALIGMVVFFILADIPLKIGWVGVDSLLLVLVYVAGIRLIQQNGQASSTAVEAPAGGPVMPLWRAALGFLAATAVLVVITPWLVRSSTQIAEITGLGTGFVGASLLAMVTSLPETVAVIAAARLGAYDMAVGNLFGSNVFNMFALGVSDLFYTPGRFLGVIDPAFALVGMLGLLLTTLALIGNIARVERRLVFVEADALLIMLVYVAGIVFLYSRGIG
ncbi:MAG: sodium:calcium antiporter [Anaerolineae bacterium]|nr:sodium:calcium antiporter [Anaerolineae bacterium]